MLLVFLKGVVLLAFAAPSARAPAYCRRPV